MIFEKVLQEMCGLNEDKSPRCAFAINEEIYKIGDTTPINTYNRVVVKPYLEVNRLPGFDKTYIKVDIHFGNINNSDISLVLKYLKDYGKKVTQLTEKSTEIPHIILTFVPLNYKGQYYFTASFPIFWCLTSANLKDEPNVLSILFDAETFNLYETRGIDYDKIIAIAESEITEQLAYEDSLEEKMEKEQEALRKKTKTMNHTNYEESPTELFKQKTQKDNSEGDGVDD